MEKELEKRKYYDKRRDDLFGRTRILNEIHKKETCSAVSESVFNCRSCCVLFLAFGK